MVEDAGQLGEYVNLARLGFSGLNVLLSIGGNDSVIAAAFDSAGSRTSGDERIEVVTERSTEEEGVWFYWVKPVDDFVFERLPVVQSVIELIGTEVGETNADSRYWRWIAPRTPGVIFGGGEVRNVKVDFVVVGYRPAALVEHFSPQT